MPIISVCAVFHGSRVFGLVSSPFGYVLGSKGASKAAVNPVSLRLSVLTRIKLGATRSATTKTINLDMLPELQENLCWWVE